MSLAVGGYMASPPGRRILAALAGCCVATWNAQSLAGQQQPARGGTKAAPAPGVIEEIYVARSTRISTTVPATDFCKNAPFQTGMILEAYFTWSSVETRTDDGRL